MTVRRLQPGAGISGAWSSVHSSLCRDHRSITACELFAMFAAAWSFRDQLKDRSVLFQVDNESDVSISNRQSTTVMDKEDVFASFFRTKLNSNKLFMC